MLEEDLLRLLRYTIRMMGGRGYNVEGFAALETISVAQFISYFGQPQGLYMNDPLRKAIIDEGYFSMRTMMSTIITSETKRCLIFFAPANEKKGASIDIVRFFLKLLDLFNITHGVLITQNELSPIAEKLFNHQPSR